MLKFLSKLEYLKVFFVLMAIPSLSFFWYKVWQNDVATAVNGVIELNLMAYIFGTLIVLFFNFLVLIIIDNIFDLDFMEPHDRIQWFFIDKFNESERLKARQMELVAHKQRLKKLNEEKEDLETAHFITQCLKKGKS